MHLRSFVAATALLCISVAAHADDFNFSFGDASSPFVGSGVLSNNEMVAPGQYIIGGVTGAVTTTSQEPSSTISSILAAGTFPTPTNGGTFPANDNTLFVTNGVGNFDGNGLSFLLSNGTQINLYDPNGSAYDAFFQTSNGDRSYENVAIAITPVATTPEPSSFALLATGLLGVAGAIKRRLA